MPKAKVNIKSTYIKFRCTRFEKRLLQVKAKRANLSLSSYCRMTALDDKIVERFTGEQIEVYKTLIEYHHHFKRIGNMFKKRNPKLTEEVYELAEEIKNHLQNFKK
ncbi:mobilization protein MbpA [Galbibacter orientalis]|uniref:mobilization protein MbpA n=1 Tax=Galbibacter orientalis TaxID=453852 RepID=UPI0030800C48